MYLIIRYNLPATEGFVLAGVGVDGHTDVDLALVEFFGGRGQRQFNGAQHNVALHVLFTGDRIDQHQQFAIHFTATFPVFRFFCEATPPALPSDS